jgi:bifunctional NMN adenylyltransferase/nudix hydrolase
MTQSRQVAAGQRRHSLAVFIGRFQPAHLGHLAVIKQALVVADHVLIAIGSANAARSHHFLPFTAAERETMIRLMLAPEENMRVNFVHVEDQGNMTKWTSLVRAAAHAIEPDPKRVTLVGHSKDNTSFYLKAFKGWGSCEVDNVDGISSTDFRNYYFSADFKLEMLARDVSLHDEVKRWLFEFEETAEYEYLVDEAEKCRADNKKYGDGPHLAGDNIIIQGDHVLLIRRKNHPFRGKLAFPAGVINRNERILDGTFRELVEETGIKVPEAVLRRSLIRTDYYDDPRRDPRYRMISFASLFYLDPQPPAAMTDPKEIAKFLALPRVKAADDADVPYPEREGVYRYWIPISEIKREDMAFDSYMMLQHALDYLPKGDQ